MDRQSRRLLSKTAAFFFVCFMGSALLHGCSTATKETPYTVSTQPEPATQTEQSADSKPTEPNNSGIRAEHKPIPFEQVLKEEEQKKTQQKVYLGKSGKPKVPPALKQPETTPKAEPKKEEIAVKPDVVVKAPKPTPTTPDVSAEPVQFSIEELPITIADNWILKTDLSQCSLHSQTQTLDDGAGKTPITLILSATNWLLKTKSDIDLSYKNTGIDLDTGEHFDLETVVKDTNLEFTKQKEAMIAAFKQASTATFSIGFWPTWPVTEPRTFTISVSHFASAHQAWQSCNQMLTAR